MHRPPDNGTLGPTVPADGLTVTVGFGHTLFDGRFGIADQKPARLKPMDPFPNDDLDPAQTEGDVLIQLCAGNPDTNLHAIRQITKATRGGLALNWRIDGFVPPPRPSGVPRNSFAFKDGIANPNVGDPDVANKLLWVVGRDRRTELGDRRELPRRAHHQAVCRVLGSGLDHRTGADDRSPPRFGSAAGRQHRGRHPRITRPIRSAT